MKKKIGLLSIVSISILTYATEYNVIIDKNNNIYEIKELFSGTGEITCNNLSPLKTDVYKETSFTQNQSDCSEKYEGSQGSIKHEPVPDRTVSELGSLVLNSCLEILNNNHSRGNESYIINYNTNEVSVVCDMTTDGGGWTQWWWHDVKSNPFPSGENDMLGHTFGSFDSTSNYGYQRLPTYLNKSSTELLAKDSLNTIYKWDFNTSSNTSTAVWNAFKNHQQYLATQHLNGNAWNPTVISGSFTAANQDSFMYREQSGVKSFIMDDDNCDCQTTLNAGANMCGANWDNSYGDGILSYGADYLNDPSCSTPETNRSLFMFFREQ